MLLKDIAKLSKLLGQFLTRFACCFSRPAGRTLLQIYVRGLLSDVQRKNAEAIALDQNVPARTLQRFLESIVWDEQLLRDRCQQIVATERRPSAVSTKQEQPKADTKQRASNDSTTAIAGRSKTASTMWLWRIQHRGLIVCWTRVCTFPKNGSAIRRAETNVRAGRRRVPNQATDRTGSDRPCQGQRHRSDGVDRRRTLRS
jgi:hypothetical protein